MTHDLASLNDRRWRAMTNDKDAVPVDAFSHLSCAVGAVICHRAPLMFDALPAARNTGDH